MRFSTKLNYYSVSVMFNKDYVLDEIRKSEQFADDQKCILDYCMRVRLENKERKEMINKFQMSVEDNVEFAKRQIVDSIYKESEMSVL